MLNLHLPYVKPFIPKDLSGEMTAFAYVKSCTLMLNHFVCSSQKLEIINNINAHQQNKEIVNVHMIE